MSQKVLADMNVIEAEYETVSSQVKPATRFLKGFFRWVLYLAFTGFTLFLSVGIATRGPKFIIALPLAVPILLPLRWLVVPGTGPVVAGRILCAALSIIGPGVAMWGYNHGIDISSLVGRSDLNYAAAVTIGVIISAIGLSIRPYGRTTLGILTLGIFMVAAFILSTGGRANADEGSRPARPQNSGIGAGPRNQPYRANLLGTLQPAELPILFGATPIPNKRQPVYNQYPRNLIGFVNFTDGSRVRYEDKNGHLIAYYYTHRPNQLLDRNGNLWR